MTQLGVQVVGSTLGLRASLEEATAVADQWAEATEAAGVKAAAGLDLVGAAARAGEVAYAKLGIAASKYSDDTVAMAAAAVRYQTTAQGLYDKQIAGANAAAAAQDAASARYLTSLRTLGRAWTTYVSLPMAIVGYESIKLATDFQASMTRVQTYAGASAEEVQRMSKALLETRNAIPQGPIQASEALYHLESIGIRGAKALDALKASGIAAGAGMADLTDSTTALGGALVAQIKGGQDAKTAMAGLISIAGQGNMTMQDLSDAMGTGLLVKAANLGISLREVGAAMDVLVDRGIPARRAATYLGTTFALMTAPSAEAKKALNDMGIQADQMGKMLSQPNGLLKVLQMLRAGMENVGQARGMRDLMDAFGRSRQSTGIQTLVQSLDAPVSSYSQKLQAYDNGVKTAAQRMADYQKTAQYQLHMAMSELEQDFIKVGKDIAPSVAAGISQIAHGIGDLTNTIEDLPEPIKKSLGLLATELAIGGPVILGLYSVKKVLLATRNIMLELGLISKTTTSTIATGMEADSAAVEGTTASVVGLRAALSATIPVAGALLAAVAAIPLEYQFAKSKYNPLGGPLTRLGGKFANTTEGSDLAAALFGTQTPQGALSDTGVTVQKQMQAATRLLNAGETLDQVTKYLQKAWPELTQQLAHSTAAAAQAAMHNATAATEGPRAAGAEAMQRAAAARYQRARAAAAARAQAQRQRAAVTPLSQTDQIQLGLAANPNDRKLIEEEIKHDDEALAYLKKLRAAGKITNAQYVAEAEKYYQDRNDMLTRIKEIDEGATRAQEMANKFVLPASMERHLQAAKAAVGDRMARLGHPFSSADLSQAISEDPKVRQAEQEERNWILKKIRSGKETAQWEIKAYDELQRLNKALAGAASGAVGPYHFASLEWLTKGIANQNVRNQVMMRIGQAQAMAGHIPTGGAHATYVTVNGGVHVHGAKNGRAVADELGKYGQRGSGTRRGRKAGKYPGR